LATFIVSSSLRLSIFLTKMELHLARRHIFKHRSRSLASSSMSFSGSSPFDGIQITTPVAVAILRIGTGLLLIIMHGLEGLLRGWQFCWRQQAWSWVEQVQSAGLPWAHVLAPTAALVIAGVGVAWVLGFLTRLFALAFIPVVLGALFMAEKLGSEPHAIECWLLLLISLALLLTGSGAISVDKLFKLGARPRKKKDKNRLSI
jgi:uncharacterized membrane protein YphA (DoxX/SURF4 family)